MAIVLVASQDAQRTMGQIFVMYVLETMVLVPTATMSLMVNLKSTSVKTAKKKMLQTSTRVVLHLVHWTLLVDNMAGRRL